MLASVCLYATGCRTTNPGTTQNLKSADSVNEEIPALKPEVLGPVTIMEIVAEARKDAVAIFGGKALFHTVIFDNTIDEGPCAGAYGARVIFANADQQAEEQRKYAMYTMNPIPSGPSSCTNSISAGPKREIDVRPHLAGSRNMDAALGGTGLIKLSIADAIKAVKKDNPAFEIPRMVSIVNPQERTMALSPWAVILGSACGQSGVVYVNLSSGKIVQAANEMKRNCR
jgi:hypothetical protein